jgi:hypothetical protein
MGRLASITVRLEGRCWLRELSFHSVGIGGTRYIDPVVLGVHQLVPFVSLSHGRSSHESVRTGNGNQTRDYNIYPRLSKAHCLSESFKPSTQPSNVSFPGPPTSLYCTQPSTGTSHSCLLTANASHSGRGTFSNTPSFTTILSPMIGDVDLIGLLPASVHTKFPLQQYGSFSP